MEGEVADPGWLVAVFVWEFRCTVERGQSQFVVGSDRKNTAMSNMAFCVWRGLRVAAIDCADVGHGSEGGLSGQNAMIDFR